MQLDLFDISGRYAVVTGANRGLGLGIAEGFAKAGANLVLISRTMPEEVLEKLRAYGVEVANFHCRRPSLRWSRTFWPAIRRSTSS